MNALLMVSKICFVILLSLGITESAQVITPPPTTSPPTYQPTTVAPTPTWTAYTWNVSLYVPPSYLVVSSSESGMILAAVSVNLNIAGSPIYLSNNSGLSWTQSPSLTSPYYGWYGIQVSGNGQYIVVVSSGYLTVVSNIYVSNNFGGSWTVAAQSSNPSSFSLSYSGQFLYLTQCCNGLYSSSNYGASFSTIYTPGNSLYGVATSSTGQYVYATTYSSSSVDGNNYMAIVVSSNYGSSWTLISLPFYYTSAALSTSSSGQYVCFSTITGGGGGSLYVSRNFGSTWSSSLLSMSTSLISNFGIAMSSSGQYMTVSTGNGILNSNTFGLNWYLEPGSPSDSYSLSMNGNGGLIVMGTSTGEVYRGENDNIYLAPTIASTVAPTAPLTSPPTTIQPTTIQSTISMPITVFSYRPSTNVPSAKSTNSPTNPTTSPSTISPSIIINYNWEANMKSYLTSNMYVSNSLSGQYILVVSAVAQAGQPIYLSNDSGISWTVVPSLTSPSTGWATVTVCSTGKYMAVTAGNTQACCNSPVYISNNYGTNWTLSSLPNSNSGYWTIVISGSGQYMYAVGAGNIMQSSNFGSSWSYSTYYSYSGSYLAISGSGQYVYLLIQSSFYISSNYGSTWSSGENIVQNYCNNFNMQSMASSKSGQFIVIFSPCPSSSFYNPYYSYVYLSSTYGISWENIQFTLESSETSSISSVSLAMSSSGQYVVANINPGGIFVSNNFGVTWYSSTGAPNSYSVSMTGNAGVIVAGTNSGFVYLGTSSLTSSPTFYPTIQLLPTINVQYSWSVSEQTSQSNMYVSISRSSGTYVAAVPALVATASLPIYLSNNGGSSWTTSSLSSPASGWATIKVSSTGQYMAVASGPYCGPSYSQLYVSSNYGISWSLSTGLPNVCDGYWKTTFSDSGQYMYAIFLNGASKIYMSSNYGVSWIALTGTPSNVYSGIVTSSSGRNVTIITSATVYQSTNYGSTWVKSTPAFINCGQSFDLASSSGKYMVVMSSCPTVVNVYVTSNYGKTWSNTASIPIATSSISLSMSSSGQVIAASFQSNGVYLSGNFGSTWTKETGAPSSYSISMVGSGTILAVGTSAGSVYLATSSSMANAIQTDFTSSLSSLRPPKAVAAEGVMDVQGYVLVNDCWMGGILMVLFSMLMLGVLVIIG